MSNMRIGISEECFKVAKYIHFGRFELDNGGYCTKVIFDKIYCIDDRESAKNAFPNLCLNSYYDRAKLNLTENVNPEKDYMGSKMTNNNHTVIATIYPNTFLDRNVAKYGYYYPFAFITPDTEQIPDIDVPSTFKYKPNTAGIAFETKNQPDLISKIITNWDNSKWLYFIDCQKITDEWCSYIIHFQIRPVVIDEVSSTELSIELHKHNENSHQGDISIFANQISAENFYSYFILNNSLNTTNSKMNGLVTPSPLQHRLVFYGTPYGYNKDEFEYVNNNNLNVLLNGSQGYKKTLQEYIANKKANSKSETGQYLFGNKQMNKVNATSGSYKTASMSIEAMNEKLAKKIGKYKKMDSVSNVQIEFVKFFSQDKYKYLGVELIQMLEDENSSLTIYYHTLTNSAISDNIVNNFKGYIKEQNITNDISLIYYKCYNADINFINEFGSTNYVITSYADNLVTNSAILIYDNTFVSNNIDYKIAEHDINEFKNKHSYDNSLTIKFDVAKHIINYMSQYTDFVRAVIKAYSLVEYDNYKTLEITLLTDDNNYITQEKVNNFYSLVKNLAQSDNITSIIVKFNNYRIQSSSN